MGPIIPGGSVNPEQEERIYSRVIWRLLPFLFLFYVVAYLDRVNIGFAKLKMLSDLGWSDTIYGTGAGIFFVGYFIFEIPSNLLLYKIGARRSLAGMMVIWGLLSAAMMLVKTPVTFYALRFALGLAEAGFFPGIIFYLSFWFPKQRRAKVTAIFWTAIAVSGIVGGPLSGWIMKNFEGVHGLSGWQWLFVMEGLPSVLMGLSVFWVLDDSIQQARWLDDGEKAILERNIAQEQSRQQSFSVLQVLGLGRVWLLCLIYFLLVMGLYGIGFWLPQLIKNSGIKDDLHIGLLSAIPYGIAIIAMVMVGKNSDRTGERSRHIAYSGFVGSAGLILSGLFGQDPMIAIMALALATSGILSALPLFWTLPTEFLSGKAGAAGIGLINSVGNLAGFASPFLVGAIKDATHSTALGLYLIASCVVAGGFLVLKTGNLFRV